MFFEAILNVKDKFIFKVLLIFQLPLSKNEWEQKITNLHKLQICFQKPFIKNKKTVKINSLSNQLPNKILLKSNWRG